MTLDYSAVPKMPDGRTAAEHIEAIAAQSEAVRVPMGNGGRMMWHVWGGNSGKPALLLFHGGSGSWIHWIANVIPLSQHFTVYAADLPGLGESDPPDDPRDMWSVARAAAAGVEAIVPRDRSYAITGFSFGGLTGSHVSTLVDDRLQRIVLVGASGLRLTREPRGKLKRLRAEMPAEELASEARRNLEILMLHDPAKVDGVAIHMQIMNTTRAVTRSRDMGAAGLLSDLLPRIKTPLSGIWGEFDSTTYPHIDQRIALLTSHQPDFRMRIVPNAGHWVAYEAADAFNAALIETLRPT